MSATRELPMPIVAQLSSLQQAEATLLHCWSRLLRLQSGSPSSASTPQSPISPTEDRSLYRVWLEQWEVAFTAFLSNTMASMTDNDVRYSRILKANHLGCTILASDAGLASASTFEAESLAIIELAGAVLRSQHSSDSPQDAKVNEKGPVLNTRLSVREPLGVVVSKCYKPSIRTRAGELLTRYPQ